MKPTFQFDVGTLFVTEGLICLIFALVLFIVARKFPDLRGSMRLSQCFFAAGASMASFLTRGFIPLTLNVVLSNGLLILAGLLLYVGIDTVLGIRPRTRLLVATSLLTLCLLAWFTAMDDRIKVRIVCLSIGTALIQIFLFIDLVRHWRRSSVVQCLAVAVLLSIIAHIAWGVATALRGTPENIFQGPSVTAIYIVTGIFSACGLGVLSLALVTREITASIERSARRDPLTGTFNRLGIEELLSIELERSRRTFVPLSLALLDIDHFKAFNDNGGHAAGDDVLCNVAASITRHLRPYDACGRIGGDEFLVLLPGSTASDTAFVCDRILGEVSAPPPHFASGIAPTVSIGFTEADRADLPADLIARADRALYAAKHQGRNCAQMELAPLQTLPPETPATANPARRFRRLRRAASSVRDSRS